MNKNRRVTKDTKMALKIYFCGSIRAGTDDAPLYAKIIAYLQENYGPVLTGEHVGNPANVEAEEILLKEDFDKSAYDRCMNWMKEADVLIAEVTKPSSGVGFELGRAVAMGKPILCMFRPLGDCKLSAMIAGAHDGEKFVVVHYKEDEVFTIVDKYLKNFIK